MFFFLGVCASQVVDGGDVQRGDTQLLQRWSSACTGVGRVGGLMGVGDINDHERRRLEEEVGGLVENGLQSEWFILFLTHVFFPRHSVG